MTRFPNTWSVYALETCLEALIDYRGKSPEKTPAGIPLITAKVVKNGRIEEPDEFIAEDAYDGWMRRGLPKTKDVLITTEAPLGEVAQVTSEHVALAQRLILLRGKSGVLDNTFLKFAMQSVFVQDQLRARSTGTTVLGIRQSELRKVLIPVPPFDQQRRISEILGALDDKIELNRRMNETLEAITRATFKSWFIDRAVIEAAHGWCQGTIGDVAESLRRSVAAAAIDPRTPYIALEHMPKRSIALNDWTDATEVESNKSRFQAGEILFGKLRPYFHKVGIAPVDGVCSTDILVIAPKTEEWYGFVLGHVSSDEMVRFVDGSSTGTKMPRASWSDIARFEVALPPRERAEAFSELTRPFFARIRSNIFESRTLAQLRDTLLPKLLSGEIRVGAAEREVAEVV